MPKFRVEMTTLARMRGFIEVEADDACEAEDKALGRSGDVSWKYEGTCDGHDGPTVQHVTETG